MDDLQLKCLTEYMDKFELEITRFRDSTKELRYAIVATHAGILSITVSLARFTGGFKSDWFIATWILQVLTMILGFVTVKISMDWEYAEAFKSYQFHMT